MASNKNNESFLIATSRRGSRPGLRRLSSTAATPKDLKDGSVVVVPPRLMAQNRSKSHHGGFAASLSQARSELLQKDLEHEDSAVLSETSTPDTPRSPVTPSDIPSADTFAFAFDIDGVLIRGGRPIPEAIEAMKLLNGDNEYGVKM